MNKELYEKYADKLLEAMKAENLMNKEVAEIFDVPASYMSDMRKHPEKVTEPFMEKIRTWAISGKPLREYKLPEAPDVDAAAITQQKLDDAERKFRSKLAVKKLVKEHAAETAAAIAQSVDTESPNVSTTAWQEIAAAIRKEYEAVQPQDEIKVVAHKDGKVDVSRLDPRTGQVAAYELQIMDDGSLHISYRFKS
ncbi:MAG TPA: hypothetical protein PLF27_11835 [Sedimentibacter sp.]|nr:hypothetical protein [Sedimentibacter sp.]